MSRCMHRLICYKGGPFAAYVEWNELLVQQGTQKAHSRALFVFLNLKYVPSIREQVPLYRRQQGMLTQLLRD